jgi:hypothetical protein
MEFRELLCPYEDRPGHVCKAHLTDVEANVPVTVITRCRKKHIDGEKRLIVFTQNGEGLIRYHHLKDEKKKRAFYTASQTVMISEDGNDRVERHKKLPEFPSTD